MKKAILIASLIPSLVICRELPKTNPLKYKGNIRAYQDSIISRQARLSDCYKDLESILDQLDITNNTHQYYQDIVSLNNISNEDLGTSFKQQFASKITAVLDAKSARDKAITSQISRKIKSLGYAFQSPSAFINGALTVISDFSPIKIDLKGHIFRPDEAVVKSDEYFDSLDIVSLKDYTDKYLSFYETLDQQNKKFAASLENNTTVISLIRLDYSSQYDRYAQFISDNSDEGTFVDNVRKISDSKELDKLNRELYSEYLNARQIYNKLDYTLINHESATLGYTNSISKALSTAASAKMFDSTKVEAKIRTLRTFTDPQNSAYLYKKIKTIKSNVLDVLCY